MSNANPLPLSPILIALAYHSSCTAICISSPLKQDYFQLKECTLEVRSRCCWVTECLYIIKLKLALMHRVISICTV